MQIIKASFWLINAIPFSLSDILLTESRFISAIKNTSSSKKCQLIKLIFLQYLQQSLYLNLSKLALTTHKFKPKKQKI
ncbi:hypothetical protein D5R81_09320 [Parashewanella spongiae]|uniref:Uncharacterized protein n=1 Tax=Parashewanella spongiae TaxID=342950 RepID=A0A3A6TU16_9GAMM|nr:hypothetical protein D5R81_09320 [Parashewanella spongiae]